MSKKGCISRLDKNLSVEQKVQKCTLFISLNRTMSNELKDAEENSIWLAITHHIKKQEITKTDTSLDIIQANQNDVPLFIKSPPN
jgi:hypothetical protein